MDLIGAGLGIATDFVPVPGLKSAFAIVKFIWDNVQKASNNRRSLSNLAVSSTEVFMAVNRVLKENDTNGYITDLLHKFEEVLTEIGKFAEEHVASNLFKILIKNVDIVGRIEYFQNRLQNLSMAFNIAALGDIRAQLGKLLEGQHISFPHAQINRLSAGSLVTPSNISQRREIKDYDPQRVKVSYSESCKIDICRKNVPTLASLYDDDMPLSTWGIATPKTSVNTKAGSFDIVSEQGGVLWTWSLMKNRISSKDLNPAYTDWKENMDLAFADDVAAVTWFKWLQDYATTKVIGGVPRPPRCDVSVRTTYHNWLQKTPDSIQHRRSRNADWVITLGGHSQSFRTYRTHFTYVSGNDVSFAKVYRSGDTIVHERSIRADTEEPTNARRFQFETEAHATAWYAAWKTCAMKLAGENEPGRVERVLVDPRTIQVFNREPVLGSALWPEIRLLHWGLKTSKAFTSRTPTSFAVASVTTTWIWTLKGNQLTVTTSIASLPDWSHSFELLFRDTKSCKAWFSYIKNYGIDDMPSILPPRAEHVTLNEVSICWMQKSGRHIQTRTAMSDSWINFFGQYKSVEEHPSHLAITSTSILPHTRISRDGRCLKQERMASQNDTEVLVTRIHKLSTESEAERWYEVWRENLRGRISG